MLHQHLSLTSSQLRRHKVREKRKRPPLLFNHHHGRRSSSPSTHTQKHDVIRKSFSAPSLSLQQPTFTIISLSRKRLRMISKLRFGALIRKKMFRFVVFLMVLFKRVSAETTQMISQIQ
ncbi:hypothetical protein L2E82_48730 [Cichorium intybus]|uniref:Uncharacterized protein n=1 Tax=Cichorium intybus TaxID=13427 RepID=A0ACB8YYY1_CICIN|nr:hypothetical protein L2E82_48730 [Cichorium intybus]